MIIRIWRGWTTESNADEYELLLTSTIFPAIEAKEVAGYRGIELLRQHHVGEVEFMTIMKFETLEDVKAFAGEDFTAAYVPAAAQTILSRFDCRSSHYELRREIEYGPDTRNGTS